MAIDTTLDQVEALYIGYFGRAGEPDGVNYWVGQLNNGYAVADMAASFSVQDEAKAEYPFLANPNIVTDPVGFITAIYQNLFERAPDADGLNYWTEQLLGRGGDAQAIGQFIQDVISGAQADDITTLDNKVDAASYYTQALANDGIGGTHLDANGHGVLDANLVASADAAVANVSSDPTTVEASHDATDAFIAGGGGTPGGGTFTLTNGDDFADNVGSTRLDGNLPSDFHFTNSNDTVNAANGTLGQSDVLLDSSTADHDALNVTTSGSIAGISTATVGNIENIHIAATGATGLYDMTNYTGVQSLELHGTIDAAGFAVSNFANSGVSSIDVSAMAAAAGSTTGAAIFDASANQNITVTGTAVDDTITLGNGDNVIHTGAGVDSVAVGTGDNTIDLGIGTNNVLVGSGGATDVGVNTITGGAGIDNVTIIGNGANTISTGGANDGVNIAGNGANTIDVGDGNDAVGILGTGANTITGGAGNDTINIGVAASGANHIDAGAGNDTINVAGAGNNTIIGGAGQDTIDLTGAAGQNGLVFNAGDSGVTTATADVVTAFVSGSDTLDFGSVAGSATNFGSFNDATATTVELAVASAAAHFDGTVEYVFIENGADGFLVTDLNHDGNADSAVSLVGVTALAQTDIVAGAVA